MSKSTASPTNTNTVHPSPAVAAEPRPRIFELIENADGGIPLHEAEDALHELGLALRQMGGGGWVNIRIAAKAEFTKGTPMAKTVVIVTSKVPKVKEQITTFFLGEDGALLRDDPAQLELDLAERKTIRLGSRRGAAATAETPAETPEETPQAAASAGRRAR